MRAMAVSPASWPRGWLGIGGRTESSQGRHAGAPRRWPGSHGAKTRHRRALRESAARSRTDQLGRVGPINLAHRFRRWIGAATVRRNAAAVSVGGRSPRMSEAYACPNWPALTHILIGIFQDI